VRARCAMFNVQCARAASVRGESGTAVRVR
jgi:hypothetical protein